MAVESNFEKAFALIKRLIDLGTRTFVVCSGSRNSPLLLHLSQFVQTENNAVDIEIVSHFDERGSAFFALGRCQREQAPVAVVVTSGTAVCELFPAIVEAHYQKLPLIGISADRPATYAYTGAPQSIPQQKIFGEFADFAQIKSLEDIGRLQLHTACPLHINIPFAEPLIDGEVKPIAAAKRAPQFTVPSDEPVDKISCQAPLVIVSGLRSFEQSFVLEKIKNWQTPIWVEAPSGLQNHPKLSHLQVQSDQHLLRHLVENQTVKSVLRIGDVPTCRFWRDLDSMDTPVFNFTDRVWSGLSRTSDTLSLSSLPISLENKNLSAIKSLDLELQNEVNQKILHYPKSESSFFRALSTCLEGSLYLGNSLPIRLWDQWSRTHCFANVQANRGVNGIDGQLATFYGQMRTREKSSAILGDITTLYDLNSFLLAPQSDWQLFIINNGGGQIFSRFYSDPLFFNSHNLKFSNLESFFGHSVKTLSDPEKLDALGDRPIVELIPDQAQEQRLNRELAELWKKL